VAFWTIDAGRGIFPQLCVELDFQSVPTSPTRFWTDVTNDVRALTYTRGGRTDELQRNQPGTLRAVFASKNGKYNFAPFTGWQPRRGMWIRVRAQWNGVVYARWQGIVETIELSWPQAGLDSIATFTASDAMKALNLFDLQGQTFTAQTGDQRLSAICTLAGLTATIADTGISTLVPVSTPLPNQSYADQHLQQVEQSENGFIFAGPDGTIVFQSRHYRTLFSHTPIGVVGDTGGTIPYRDSVVLQLDDAYLVNKVTVTPTNADGSLGTPVTVTDHVSSVQYFARNTTVVDRTILVSGEALAAAQWLLARYKEPSPRVPTVNVLGVRNPKQWPTILAADNSDRLTFKRTAYSPIVQDCYVEQITDAIVPNTSWDVTFQLSPADASLFWLAQVVGFGEAGVTTRGSY